MNKNTGHEKKPPHGLNGRDYQVLSEAFNDVLDRYALLVGDPIEDEQLIFHEDEYVNISVGYAGGHRGRIGMAVPVNFCRMLTAAVLGESVDPLSAPDLDPAKEFVNIMCGEFLTKKQKTEGKFTIQPPACEGMDRREWRRMAGEVRRGFMVHGNPVIIWYSEAK